MIMPLEGCPAAGVVGGYSATRLLQNPNNVMRRNPSRPNGQITFQGLDQRSNTPFPCPFLAKLHPCLFIFYPSFCPSWDRKRYMETR